MNFDLNLMGYVPQLGGCITKHGCLIGEESAAREMAEDLAAMSGLDILSLEPISDETRERLLNEGVYRPGDICEL